MPNTQQSARSSTGYISLEHVSVSYAQPRESCTTCTSRPSCLFDAQSLLDTYLCDKCLISLFNYDKTYLFTRIDKKDTNHTRTHHTGSLHRPAPPTRPTDPPHRLTTPTRHTGSPHGLAPPTDHTDPPYRLTTRTHHTSSPRRDSPHRLTTTAHHIVILIST